MTDDALLDACLRGEPAAWDALVDRHLATVASAVRRTLQRYTGRTDAAQVDDLAQDVLLKLIDRDFWLLRRFDPARASLPTWLALIARSTTIDALRKQRLRPVDLDAASGAAAPQPEDAPEAPRIPPGLLSPRQELVLQLSFDEGLDVPEIAERLGVEAQTVRSTRHKALAKLRKHFGAT